MDDDFLFTCYLFYIVYLLVRYLLHLKITTLFLGAYYSLPLALSWAIITTSFFFYIMLCIFSVDSYIQLITDQFTINVILIFYKRNKVKIQFVRYVVCIYLGQFDLIYNLISKISFVIKGILFSQFLVVNATLQ